MTIRSLKFAAALALLLAPTGAFATSGLDSTGAGAGRPASSLLQTADNYATDLRPCQPGTHSESYPNQQGYRCVLNRR
jgi:hypothetical protein